MYAVLMYEPADDVATRAPEHFPAHRARIAEFHARGELVMVGPFARPSQGAMGIFTSRPAAEAFALGDPFVLNGVVRAYEIRDWHEIITGSSDTPDV